MSDARLSDYVNLKDALRSFSQEFESLQRTNEELRAKKDHAVRNRNEWATKHAELDRNSVPRSRYDAVCREVDGWRQKYGDLTAKATAEIDRLEAAAITPEMRERIRATVNLWDLCQRDMNADLASDFAPCAMDVLRDLLKETVEPTLEGEK